MSDMLSDGSTLDESLDTVLGASFDIATEDMLNTLAEISPGASGAIANHIRAAREEFTREAALEIKRLSEAGDKESLKGALDYVRKLSSLIEPEAVNDVKAQLLPTPEEVYEFHRQETTQGLEIGFTIPEGGSLRQLVRDCMRNYSENASSEQKSDMIQLLHSADLDGGLIGEELNFMGTVTEKTSVKIVLLRESDGKSEEEIIGRKVETEDGYTRDIEVAGHSDLVVAEAGLVIAAQALDLSRAISLGEKLDRGSDARVKTLQAEIIRSKSKNQNDNSLIATSTSRQGLYQANVTPDEKEQGIMIAARPKK